MSLKFVLDEMEGMNGRMNAPKGTTRFVDMTGHGQEPELPSARQESTTTPATAPEGEDSGARGRDGSTITAEA